LEPSMVKLTKNYVGTIVLGMALTTFVSAGVAQGRAGDDRGKGGDARRGDDRGRETDNQGRRDEKPEYHFRPEDRGRFSSHYQGNIKQMQKHPDKRHHIRAGEHLPSDYRSHLKSVPASYYRNMPPPPPGYRFGYYDGYVVAYNPTTQIVADVLDLVNAAVNH
jgi:Ni/Co efflux regulator RcnB